MQLFLRLGAFIFFSFTCLQELYSQEIGDFHLLEEILGEMTGFKANSLVGENQMNALAGGPLLKSIILTTPWHKDKSYTTPSRCAH